ncbi:hypothetical protein F2Q70_00002959 [Brassica cretica]|uniref:Uncharacterized protein n=1 Tax=Brassica cretica TaxID=69181 RepID=A0A8S9IZJ0_BRACR|nr:hypothetical protein F2Q70_00002959 [Brassica cretica]
MKSRNKGQTVREKYSGLEFLQTPGRTPAFGSPLGDAPGPARRRLGSPLGSTLPNLPNLSYRSLEPHIYDPQKGSKQGRHVATGPRTSRSLRSDRPSLSFGRYVATDQRRPGRYVATELSRTSINGYDPNPCILVCSSMLAPIANFGTHNRAALQSTVGCRVVLTLSPKSGLGWWILKLCGIIGWAIMFLSDCWSTGSRYLKLDHGRRLRVEAASLLSNVRSWSNFCDYDRIIPSRSRSASGPWCWVGRSVMFLFDCWLAGWPFISSPWCGSSVGHVLV